MHINVEDLMYEFVKFLKRNSLYAEMIIKRDEWKVIIIEYECINVKRRNVIEVRKIVASRWKQKLLNLWISEKDFSLYSIKKEVMIKMYAAIAKVESEDLVKAMMK